MSTIASFSTTSPLAASPELSSSLSASVSSPTTSKIDPATTLPARRPPQCVLAPMVRSGELPNRLMALKYGADLVWTPEIVDKAIIGTTRTVNTSISCVDFSKTSNNSDAARHVLRIHPTREAGKLIFQLGTADPDLAVEAAKIVAHDVDGIDLNSGCPKHFSIHSGMGAALLKTPEKLCKILTSLVEAVGPGTEYNTPVSVKIRLLEPHTETFGLVEKLVKTGIKRLTVHMRTTPMRPREAAIREPEIIKGIVKICKAAGVEVFLNGDVSCRADAEQLCNKYDLDGCMIARAAEANTSCFIGGVEDMKPFKEVAQECLRTAMEVDNNFPNTKFILSHIIDGKSPLYNLVTRSKSFKEACEHLEVEHISGLTADVEDKRMAKKKKTKREAEEPLAESIPVTERENKRRVIDAGITEQAVPVTAAFAL